MNNGRVSKRFIPNAIQCFLSVCRTRSFSLAAKQMGTSQSSVSRSIIELEADLGCQLVERETRPIKITKAGLYLEQSFSLYQDALQKAVEDIRAQNSLRMPLRVGVIESLTDCLARTIAAELSNNSLMISAISTRLLELLDTDKLDIIVCSKPFSNRNDLNRTFLLQEPSVVVVSKNVTFPEPLTWKYLQYCGLAQIAYDETNSGGAMEQRLFNEHGQCFVHRIEVDLNVTMMNLVSANMGWAITRVTSLVQFPKYAQELNVYSMPDPLASREIFLIYKNTMFADVAARLADSIGKTIENELIPAMIQAVPWIKPYLYIRGNHPMDRRLAFPDAHAQRTPVVF